MTARPRLGVDAAGRAVAGVAVLVGGWIHLRLYEDGYRDIPDIRLGRSFLVNVVASGAVVALLATWRSRWALLATVAVTLGTLAAFARSRVGSGVFGLAERGLQPSPDALVALVAELTALTVCVVLLLGRRPRTAPR